MEKMTEIKKSSFSWPKFQSSTKNFGHRRSDSRPPMPYQNEGHIFAQSYQNDGHISYQNENHCGNIPRLSSACLPFRRRDGICQQCGSSASEHTKACCLLIPARRLKSLWQKIDGNQMKITLLWETLFSRLYGVWYDLNALFVSYQIADSRNTPSGVNKKYIRLNCKKSGASYQNEIS